MTFFKNISLSTYAILLITLACLTVDLSLKNWEKRDRVIEHDIHWYYAYLPSAFIYHDIKEEKSDYRFDDDYYLFWPTITPDGKKVTKTTLGLSILYGPFFFMAHAYACLSDYPENGFSEPYKAFLLLSAVFYLIIGLDFVRKVLRRYGFSDAHTAITLLLAGLGTNLLCYASQSAPMSHVYNFCLFAVFIYCTIRWYGNPSLKYTVVTGLLLGLISLIRPSNALIIVFFLLYNVYDIASFRERIALLRKKLPLLCLMGFLTILVWVPQLLYWKAVTGSYIYYSYTDERFFFTHPHILKGLFSFRKGWLLYTPMMIFPLIGLFLKKPVLHGLRFPIALFTVLNIYIIFSWWCWWYGGTFGQRSMIESYALLAIPFAAVVRSVARHKLWLKIAFSLACVFFIWLNVFQMYQYENLSLHWEGMTRELYFKQFGKMDKIAGYDRYVSFPNFEAAKRGEDCETPVTTASAAPAQQIPLQTNEKVINIKASNGKFLCDDENKNFVIYANRDIAQGWETFRITYLDNNRCTIQSENGLYFTAELDKSNRISGGRPKASDWETFIIEKQDDNTVAFRASNGKYWSLNLATSEIIAKADIAGPREKFEISIK